MKTLLLIDAHAYIHRSYHALPPLTTPGGEPIGAIFGLASTLLKVLREIKPDYVAAAFDRPEPTFRKEQFPDYKAHRPPAEADLISQMVKAHELFGKFGIPVSELSGYEADDIIGTFVEKLAHKDLKIMILTGDLDALQLVKDDSVVVQTPKRGAELSLYNETSVRERYGLPPEAIPDYKGLVGDPSDNIPGVKGIGPKTATKLLQEFGTIEELYKKLPSSNPIAKKLLPQKECALFSKTLATIKTDVPIDLELGSFTYKGIPKEVLVPYFTELGFQSLLKRLNGDAGVGPAAPLPREEDFFIVRDAEHARENKETLVSPKLKVAHSWKEILKQLQREGVTVLPPFFDIQIAGWLLDPDQNDFSLQALGKRLLKLPSASKEDLLSKLFAFFWRKIYEYDLKKVFDEIEMPLMPVLAGMEERGIGVSAKLLRKLRNDIGSETQSLAEAIYHEAGEEFNINSPQQVSRVLFEKLRLGSDKKRKTGTGHARTSKEVLSELRDKHPIVNLILQYRENTKIATGFVEPILASIQKDGRVHTTFLQTGTTTGRLASEKPNLQNIPQESKWSAPLRHAFISKEGFSFLSLDYSQLELRLLAEVSGDEKLRTAFRNGEDIHTTTAMNVFNVPRDWVDAQMRRLAKTLNFGIIYGMGARAFAEAGNLPLEEASKFIAEYFRDFPAVREWQKRVVEEMRTFGFVKNKNGRRRWFLELLYDPARGDFERQAINMPIQGLGADILKLAMTQSARLIQEKQLGEAVRLLLSIHDELLFEMRDDILMDVLPLFKDAMEHVYTLSIPLTAEAKRGKNWGDMESLT